MINLLRTYILIEIVLIDHGTGNTTCSLWVSVNIDTQSIDENLLSWSSVGLTNWLILNENHRTLSLIESGQRINMQMTLQKFQNLEPVVVKLSVL